VQGEVEFRSILYIPSMGPLNNEEVVSPKTKNIRLYVKRVFISDDFDGELVSLPRASKRSFVLCIIIFTLML
jgi:HSP90 family molecular chaperone